MFRYLLGVIGTAFASVAVTHTWEMDLRWNYIKLGQSNLFPLWGVVKSG